MATDGPTMQSLGIYTGDMDPIEKIILNSMNEGVITIDCDGKIFTVNPSAFRMLGLGADAIVGRRFDDVFSDSQGNQALIELFSRVVHEGRHTLHEEIQYRRKDGQRMDLAVASSRLDFDACVPGLQTVAMVFRDITAFKSIERSRRKAVDHLSHELKTPLAIVKASVEMLAQRGLSQENSVRILDRIDRNLTRLINIQEIVSQILNPPPYRPQFFDVADRIRKCIDSIGRDSRHRAVSLVTHLEDVHADVIDPNIFDIILQTLTKNAIEGTPNHGEVLISLRRVQDGILLEVEDHGIGIPVGEEEFIFDGFHHIQNTEDYSSKKPYDFNAGGKGLELLRLKVLSEISPFDISFESNRCEYIPTRADYCPGDATSCTYVRDWSGCKQSSATIFSVKFY